MINERTFYLTNNFTKNNPKSNIESREALSGQHQMKE